MFSLGFCIKRCGNERTTRVREINVKLILNIFCWLWGEWGFRNDLYIAENVYRACFETNRLTSFFQRSKTSSCPLRVPPGPALSPRKPVGPAACPVRSRTLRQGPGPSPPPGPGCKKSPWSWSGRSPRTDDTRDSSGGLMWCLLTVSYYIKVSLRVLSIVYFAGIFGFEYQWRWWRLYGYIELYYKLLALFIIVKL